MPRRVHLLLPMLLALSLPSLARCASPRDGFDLTEFSTPQDATTFGWEPAKRTQFSMTDDRKVGRHALRIDAQSGVGEYSGADLHCVLDLTGAGANDKIAFFVKQNYGTGMRVQLWTETGPVNRSFPVNYDGWTRVELDLDINHWDNPQGARWGVVTRIQFYEKTFAAEGQYMILDGVTMTARGRRVKPAGTEGIESWTFPHETDTAWRLGNDDAAWAVSKSTGQVIGGWNVRTQTPYLLSLVGRYHLDDPRTLTTAIENEDVVQSATYNADEQRIELTCSNPIVPDLIITKQYWLRGNKLFQRVGFTTTSDELQFVTYNAQARFEISYRNSGYYMGGGDGGGPLVPAPQVTGWQKVTQHQNTPKGMVLSQPELQYSFAQVRTRIDNTFVWPWFTGAIASYCEPNNIMHYTPDGWDMSLGTSKLSQTSETTFEQYLTIFEGDWQTFHRDEYSQLPEVQAALAEIPPTPNWVADIYADASCDITRLQYLLDTTDEGNLLVLVDLGGSWADYYVDKGINGGWGGGSIEAQELRDLIGRLQALSPRVKVGIYMWVLTTSETTSIFKAHPEWFRLTNKDGEPLNTFPGLMMNFAHILSIQECYDELLSQFDLVLEYLDTDFIYLDDPKAINSIDWTSGEFNRDDISFQFFLDIKRIAASHGPDKMVFYNNRGNPYADVNYIEARSTLDANFWRQFAGIAAAIEQFTAATKPDSRIVPLYYVPPHDREYINHVLALGWIPDLANSNTDQLIERRGFAQAAYEVGNASPVAARYSPDWKRDKDTQIESFAMQRGGDTGYLLSFIDHQKTARVVPVEIDLSSLSLAKDQPVFIWRYVVENANEFKTSVSEDMARDAYGDAGWLLDHIARRTLVYSGPYRDTITVDVPFEPLVMNQLYVTSQPTAVYAQNDLTTQYLFNQMPRVALRDTSDWSDCTIEVHVDSQRETAQVIAFLPLSRYRLLEATVDGRAIEPQQVFEGGDVLPVITVAHGRHTVRMRFEAINATTPVAVAPIAAQATSNSIDVELPGSDAAAITIERDGRIVYNRVSQRGEHGFQLPLAGPRGEGGSYTVTLCALVAGDGTVTLTDAQPIAIDLPTAPRDERLIAPRPAIMPGSRQIADVNRTIEGVRVLRSATVTTNTLRGTFQPDVEALMAEVEPDALSMQAGTTSKIEHTTRGAAFAGLEIADVRKLKVELSNTFYNAFHLFGKGLHMPPWNTSTRPFAGIVVDYHTVGGYTKRVALSVGVMHADCTSVQPDYGKATVADEYYDLGKSLIESPEHTFVLDLERFAPDDWDGQVWLSVGSDWVASDRRLTLRILAVNDAVAGRAIEVTDPRMVMEAFLKPRTLRVPRSPGGIIIDGPSDEEMWRGAAITDQFFLHGGDGYPEADTTAKLLYDDDNLYVAFVCEEPTRRKPLVQGGAVWNDDEVEVWLDINGDRETFTQVLLNSVNTKLEYSESGVRTINATTATYVAEGERWMVEMAIPFASLGVDMPKPGDTWRVSLCRYRPAGEDFNDEIIVWAPLQREGFKDLANFGTLIFE